MKGAKAGKEGGGGEGGGKDGGRRGLLSFFGRKKQIPVARLDDEPGAKLYYNKDLKMWVEPGKEDEAKAMAAPPPPPKVPASSAPTAPTQRKALHQRYALQPNLSVSSGNLVDQDSSSSRQASPAPTPAASLLPAGPPTAASAPSIFLPGTSSPKSGVPAWGSPTQNGGAPTQPKFFVPGGVTAALPGSSSTGSLYSSQWAGSNKRRSSSDSKHQQATGTDSIGQPQSTDSLPQSPHQPLQQMQQEPQQTIQSMDRHTEQPPQVANGHVDPSKLPPSQESQVAHEAQHHHHHQQQQQTMEQPSLAHASSIHAHSHGDGHTAPPAPPPSPPVSRPAPKLPPSARKQNPDPFNFDSVMHPGGTQKLDGPLPWELPDHLKHSDQFISICSNWQKQHPGMEYSPDLLLSSITGPPPPPPATDSSATPAAAAAAATATDPQPASTASFGAGGVRTEQQQPLASPRQSAAAAAAAETSSAAQGGPAVGQGMPAIEDAPPAPPPASPAAATVTAAPAAEAPAPDPDSHGFAEASADIGARAAQHATPTDPQQGGEVLKEHMKPSLGQQQHQQQQHVEHETAHELQQEKHEVVHAQEQQQQQQQLEPGHTPQQAQQHLQQQDASGMAGVEDSAALQHQQQHHQPDEDPHAQSGGLGVDVPQSVEQQHAEQQQLQQQQMTAEQYQAYWQAYYAQQAALAGTDASAQQYDADYYNSEEYRQYYAQWYAAQQAAAAASSHPQVQVGGGEGVEEGGNPQQAWSAEDPRQQGELVERASMQQQQQQQYGQLPTHESLQQQQQQQCDQLATHKSLQQQQQQQQQQHNSQLAAHESLQHKQSQVDQLATHESLQQWQQQQQQQQPGFPAAQTQEHQPWVLGQQPEQLLPRQSSHVHAQQPLQHLPSHIQQEHAAQAHPPLHQRPSQTPTEQPPLQHQYSQVQPAHNLHSAFEGGEAGAAVGSFSMGVPDGAPSAFSMQNRLALVQASSGVSFFQQEDDVEEEEEEQRQQQEQPAPLPQPQQQQQQQQAAQASPPSPSPLETAQQSQLPQPSPLDSRPQGTKLGQTHSAAAAQEGEPHASCAATATAGAGAGVEANVQADVQQQQQQQQQQQGQGTPGWAAHEVQTRWGAQAYWQGVGEVSGLQQHDQQQQAWQQQQQQQQGVRGWDGPQATRPPPSQAQHGSKDPLAPPFPTSCDPSSSMKPSLPPHPSAPAAAAAADGPDELSLNLPPPPDFCSFHIPHTGSAAQPSSASQPPHQEQLQQQHHHHHHQKEQQHHYPHIPAASSKDHTFPCPPPFSNGSGPSSPSRSHAAAPAIDTHPHASAGYGTHVHANGFAGLSNGSGPSSPLRSHAAAGNGGLGLHELAQQEANALSTLATTHSFMQQLLDNLAEGRPIHPATLNAAADLMRLFQDPRFTAATRNRSGPLSGASTPPKYLTMQTPVRISTTRARAPSPTTDVSPSSQHTATCIDRSYVSATKHTTQGDAGAGQASVQAPGLDGPFDTSQDLSLQLASMQLELQANFDQRLQSRTAELEAHFNERLVAMRAELEAQYGARIEQLEQQVAEHQAQCQEKQEELDDLMACLGQEAKKVGALSDAMADAGLDPEATIGPVDEEYWMMQQLCEQEDGGGVGEEWEKGEGSGVEDLGV